MSTLLKKWFIGKTAVEVVEDELKKYYLDKSEPKRILKGVSKLITIG